VRFDIIQSFEVLHLILDRSLVASALANLSTHLAPRGALLVTAVLPAEDLRPTPTIWHQSRAEFVDMLKAARLCITAERPMYYWLPDGGPSSRYLRFLAAKLGPAALYWSDRVGLALGAPRWLQQGSDSRMKLLTVERVAS
jgi:hypothetical protein